MNLVINKGDLEITNFSYWLIPYIQEFLINQINKRKLIKFDKFLNDNKIIYFNYKEDRIISSKNILIGAIYNLRVINKANEIIIEINPNSIIPNTSAKFIDIIKLINYGNLLLEAYPILDKTMEYFASNIDYYYEKYMKGAK